MNFKLTSVCLCVFLHLGNCDRGTADEIEEVATLPPPGSWVKYHAMTIRDDGSEHHFDETIEWKDVEVDKQGRKCRWIESRAFIEAEDSTLVTRLLVPVEALLKSADPLREAIKLERSVNDGPFVDLTFTAPLHFNMVLLCPAIKIQREKLDTPKIVKYQQGALSISESRTAVFKGAIRPQDTKIQTEYDVESTFYSHPTIVAGAAEIASQATLTVKGESKTIKTSYHLTDAGRNESAE